MNKSERKFTMLEFVNQIIQSESFQESDLNHLKTVITVPSLLALSPEEIAQIYSKLTFYFKEVLTYFYEDSILMLQVQEYFFHTLNHPNVIHKLLYQKKILIPNQFEQFLSQIGHIGISYRHPHKDFFESTAFFALLLECYRNFSKQLPNIIDIFDFLTAEEQTKALSYCKNQITKEIYFGNKAYLLELFRHLHPQVLNECYSSDWFPFFKMLDPEILVSLLNQHQHLIYFEDIYHLVEKYIKEEKSLLNLFPYYYFEQSLQHLKQINQIISQSTLVNQLSDSEQHLATLIQNIFQNIPLKDTLSQIQKIEDYQSKLYDICSHLRLLSASNLTSNIFLVDPSVKEMTLDDKCLLYFFIRTNTSSNPFLSSGKSVNAASFSIISTKNPSNYLGHKRTIFGYSHIDPHMILHIYPHDSLSDSQEKYPYFYSQFQPFYTDIHTLSELSEDSYNEILVLKKQFELSTLKPDYILGINGFSEQDLAFAEELQIPKVKLLTKQKKIHTQDYYESLQFKEDTFKNLV